MQTYISAKRDTWLPWFARGLMFLIFILLTGRLIELSVIKSAFYKNLAQGNRIRRVTITAPRGKILARGGEVLVTNKEVKKKVVFDPEEGYEKIEDLAGAQKEEIISEWERYYPLGSKFAHISGYIGLVMQDELNRIDPKCSEKGPKKITSVVGRSGLEEYYNCQLTGIDGELLLEVDTTGKIIRLLGRREPIPGGDLHTNIDYGLQIKLAQLIETKEGVSSNKITKPLEINGTGIVTDSKGEVLALYSYPSYDPNLFIIKNNENEINNILHDVRQPLFNRAISGVYHPGSVYKPLVALASLEEKIIDKDYRFIDEGRIEIKSIYGDFVYNNWYFTQYGGVEGEIDVTRALARSTDTFFYKVGELLGIDKLVVWSEKLGLSSKSNIDLTGEITGLIPSPKWKDEVKHERWFLGNTYHMAIGQGDLAITPVELIKMITAIANSGSLCDIKVMGKPNCSNLNVDKKNIDLIKTGMGLACSTGGTGFSFFDFNPSKISADESKKVACKTGTAEVADGRNPHAWFVAYSPVDEPQIISAVIFENAGEGSQVAGPVTRKLFDYWYGR